MMRIFVLIFMVFSIPGLILAQDRRGKKKVKKEKIALLTAPGGYHYDIFPGGSQMKVEEGDLAYFTLQTYHLDSIIEDSKNFIMIPEYVMPTKDSVANDGPVAAGLSMMSLGDSLVIYEKIDTIADKPAEMKDWKEINYRIKVIELTKKSELERIKVKKPEILKLVNQNIDDYINQRFEKILHTQKGVSILVHQDGKGEGFKPGDVAFIRYYAVSIKDRKYFRSTFDTGKPSQIIVGSRRAIDGLTEALSILKRGAVVTAFIPSRLAYGEEGIPGELEGDADMTFFIEVIDK